MHPHKRHQNAPTRPDRKPNTNPMYLTKILIGRVVDNRIGRLLTSDFTMDDPSWAPITETDLDKDIKTNAFSFAHNLPY
jgi:hypothetical protein